jgi:hypothetical protein
MDMVKTITGAFAAAVAMFIAGFIFFASPLYLIGFSSAGEAQSAAIQASLASNLPHTGTYIVPNPSTPEGTVMYGKGPIALVHYNSNGFAASDVGVLVKGFIHNLIVCLIIAFALARLDRRIPDFASRARIVVMFSVASSALLHLGQPIWFHQGWVSAIYLFIADAVRLSVAGLIIARWFLPTSAEMPSAATPLSGQ